MEWYFIPTTSYNKKKDIDTYSSLYKVFHPNSLLWEDKIATLESLTLPQKVKWSCSYDYDPKIPPLNMNTKEIRVHV